MAGLRARINRFLGEANAALPASQRAMHIDSHDTLVDIIARRDLAAAHAEMTNHVLGAKTRILAYCDLAG